MCSTATLYRPRPHSMSMKPIWASVEYAREALIAVAVIIIVEPARTEIKPIRAIESPAQPIRDMIGLMRSTRKVPV